jgi:peptidoglycan/xylan/chitin deacetylase (PgdA/CDA1 family)
MPILSTPGLRTDIAAAGEAIQLHAGVDPRPWFRCPFGAGSRDRRVLAEVERAGYRHVGWHVAAEDWDPNRTSRQVEDDVVSGVTAHGDGAVVLLHSWPDRNLSALPRIIERLSRDGWVFVRVDALDPVPALPGWAEAGDSALAPVPSGATPAGS